MAFEYTYPITINDREFLLGVAAYPIDGVSIPDLLVVKGLREDLHATRTMYQTAARCVELGWVDKFVDDSPRKRAYRRGAVAVNLYRITEQFAPELLDIAINELVQAKSAIKGLRTKFDF